MPPTLLSYIVAGATLLTALNAAPSPNLLGLRAILKRDKIKFDASCGEDGSPMKSNATQGLIDASTLANAAINGMLDDNTPYQKTNAFKHYFEDSHYQTVQDMFGNIQAGSSGDSGNGFQLDFIITCENAASCDGGSLAVTDAGKNGANGGPPMMRLCPKFFTDPSTKNNLQSHEYKKNPGRRDDSWCQPNKPFAFFETAGNTILHEMTHLDQLGLSVGLDPPKLDNADGHGTYDIYEVAKGYGTIPEKAARLLKAQWDKLETWISGIDPAARPKLQTIENAESYAASATEFWFQKQCGWDNIME